MPVLTTASHIMPYLALTAHPAIGAVLLDPRPAWVWNHEGNRIIWSNAAGLAFFQESDMQSLLDRTFGDVHPARRHLARLALNSRTNAPLLDRLRFFLGMNAVTTTCLCKKLEVEGESMVLVLSTDADIDKLDEAESATRLIEALSPNPPVLSAIMDGDSHVLAASAGFESLVDFSQDIDALLSGADEDCALAIDLLKEDAAKRIGGVARVGQGLDARYLLLVAQQDGADSALADFSALEDGDESGPYVSEDDMAKEADIFDMSSDAIRHGLDNKAGQPSMLEHLEGVTFAKDGASDHIERPLPEARHDQENAADDAAPSSHIKDPAQPASNIVTLPFGQSHEERRLSEREKKEAGKAKEKAPVLVVSEGPKDGNPPIDRSIAAKAKSGAKGFSPFVFDKEGGPYHFVWESDEIGRFSFISKDLSLAVGPDHAAIVGQSWGELAARLDMDKDGQVAAAFEERDTWTGLSVYWPVQGHDIAIPVELTGLPVFGRFHGFQGFRGFGICRVHLAVSLSHLHSDLPLPAPDADTATGALKEEDWQDQPATLALDHSLLDDDLLAAADLAVKTAGEVVSGHEQESTEAAETPSKQPTDKEADKVAAAMHRLLDEQEPDTPDSPDFGTDDDSAAQTAIEGQGLSDPSALDMTRSGEPSDLPDDALSDEEEDLSHLSQSEQDAFEQIAEALVEEEEQNQAQQPETQDDGQDEAFAASDEPIADRAHDETGTNELSDLADLVPDNEGSSALQEEDSTDMIAETPHKKRKKKKKKHKKIKAAKASLVADGKEDAQENAADVAVPCDDDQDDDAAIDAVSDMSVSDMSGESPPEESVPEDSVPEDSVSGPEDDKALSKGEKKRKKAEQKKKKKEEKLKDKKLKKKRKRKKLRKEETRLKALKKASKSETDLEATEPEQGDDGQNDDAHIAALSSAVGVASSDLLFDVATEEKEQETAAPSSTDTLLADAVEGEAETEAEVELISDANEEDDTVDNASFDALETKEADNQEVVASETSDKAEVSEPEDNQDDTALKSAASIAFRDILAMDPAFRHLHDGKSDEETNAQTEDPGKQAMRRRNQSGPRFEALLGGLTDSQDEDTTSLDVMEQTDKESASADPVDDMPEPLTADIASSEEHKDESALIALSHEAKGPVDLFAHDGLGEDTKDRHGDSASDARNESDLPAALAAASWDMANDLSPVLDKIPFALIISASQKPVYANNKALELLDFDSLQQFEKTGGMEALFGRLPGDWLTKTQGLSNLRKRDGSPFSADVKISSIQWQKEPAALLTFEAAQTEPPGIGLSEEDQKIAELEAILDTATDGVIVLDERACILRMNHSAEALFEVDRHDMAGNSFLDLLAEESHKDAIDYLDGLVANGVASVLNDGREVIGRISSGGLIPLFMTMGRVAIPGTNRFCAVVRDIAQWKRVEEDLLAEKRRAEKASHQKSDFLAKISHEIRTPLNAIIGFSEVMMDERFGAVGNERYKDYLKDIHTSGSHIMSLINDLLDLSKVEAGKMDLSFQATELNALIQESVGLMQPQANREQIIIRTSLASSLPDVVGDARSLRQIILNLLSNGVKYTPAGGQVIISTSYEENGEVILRIRDTGIGMSEEEAKMALEPFRQVSSTANKGGQGTGLGLPLTKALVEANRARFSLVSARDHGTLVEITFPNARVLAG
ncbi:MAG: ATP-binding protein [Cohaesibacter sp.]|nr:ATP-binding protein [Cohaesibacter sp.]